MLHLKVISESWAIRGTFTISRGSKTQVDVVVVELEENGIKGYGECVPYSRYGESIESVMQQIHAVEIDLRNGLTRQQLQKAIPAGAARNAIDCALWDLQAKQSGQRVWETCQQPMQAVITSYTLSLDTPDNMYQAALANSYRPLLKLKLGGAGDLERVRAVRKGAASSRIIVDANEGWTVTDYEALVPELVKLDVEMLEQPFVAGEDEVLRNLARPITVCADESCHDIASMAELKGKYDMVNIKLDKTGGLSEALAMRQIARDQGMAIMVGCMLATSLAMAPAAIVAQDAEIVDLDGPLLLQKDRPHGLRIEQSLVYPPDAMLWG